MRILVPLPDRDFDTTEVAVPWRLLADRGHDIIFATQAGGRVPRCDPRLLDGVIFGRLGAEPEPISFYEELTQDADLNFQRLFCEKFAQAYEEQMRRLTAVRR